MRVMLSSVTSRTALAGEPKITERSGKFLFSVMTEPAPTRQSLPITELFSTIASMPIRVPSPIVQPCSMTWWPMVTPLPSVSGSPGSVCRTQFSWTLLSSPITIGSLSPRITAPNMTFTRSPRVTCPMIVASGAM